MRSQRAPQMLWRVDRPLVSAGIGVQQGWRGAAAAMPAVAARALLPCRPSARSLHLPFLVQQVRLLCTRWV